MRTVPRRSHGTLLAAAIVLLAATIAAAAERQALQRIPNPSPQAYAHFGFAVAGAGDAVLVGAPNDATLPHGSGAAYLVDAASNTIRLSLADPTAGGFDLFGYAVAAAGSDLVVGAPGDATQGTSNGAVFLFDGTTGALKRTFLEPGPLGGTTRRFFGSAVAALGTNVLVGGRSTQAVYLFDGATGAVLRTYGPPTPGAISGLFGFAVGVLGGNVLVSTPGEDPAGAVYLLDADTGAVLQSFLPPAGANLLDEFGHAVTDVGGDVLVGAPFNDVAGENAGAAYLFDAATGALLQTLAPGSYAYFGWAVGSVGGKPLVGAPRGEQAFLFDPESGGVLEEYERPFPSNEFGSAVATAGGKVFVGASFADVGKTTAVGALYAFDTCGNGAVADREQCDDGNTDPGDGCSDRCRLELCPGSPAPGCRGPNASGASTLSVRHFPLLSHGQLGWSWKGGALRTDFEDPQADASYLLCIYDSSGQPQPRMALAVPAGGNCGTRPCWRPAGASGFRYADPLRTPDGVSGVQLKAGGRIVLKGRGENLGLALLVYELAPKITLQLFRTGAGTCWQADFSTLTGAASGDFTARSD
jgi:cysteine-rich repeat protein